MKTRERYYCSGQYLFVLMHCPAINIATMLVRLIIMLKTKNRVTVKRRLLCHKNSTDDWWKMNWANNSFSLHRQYNAS